MRRAGIIIYAKQFNVKRVVAHKFEENSRVNIAKMMKEHTTDILGQNAVVLTRGQKEYFAFEIDDGGNVTIWAGDLSDYQEHGFRDGSETGTLSLSREQLSLLVP